MARGFGVAAGLDAEVARPLAARCAELGYDSHVVQRPPRSRSGSRRSPRSPTRRPSSTSACRWRSIAILPPEIAADIERLGLDPAPLWLGVGAGFSTKPLTAMREAEPELREALPGVRLVLAAMGPKMCALAGAEVRRRLLQLDDARVRGVRPRARRDRAPPTPSRGCRRSSATCAPRSATTPPSGWPRRRRFYRDLHDGYRNHFDRLGEPEGTVGVAASDARRGPGAARRATTRSTPSSCAASPSAKVESMNALAEAVAP